MNNTLNYPPRRRLIPSESTSEWFFIVLVCLFWASGLFGFIFVVADKVLDTDMFIRTIGKTIIFIVFAIFSLKYCSTKIRMQDLALIFLFLLLFFLSPGPSLMSALQFEEYTRSFLWALPLYLIGVSLDFPKSNKVLHVLTIATIIVNAYYRLIYIHASGYSGDAVNDHYDMSASYGLLLPTMFMIWKSFNNFNIKSVVTWIDILIAVLGLFTIMMLGTRGPLIGTVLFLFLYLFLFKLSKHRLLFGLLFLVVAYVFIGYTEDIFMFMASLAADLGFSDRIFVSFLSIDNLLTDGSSGRDDFYPILFKALSDSPILGYGFWGSYEFIGTYPHNLFMEIIFTFGYFLGGIILIFGAYSTIKAFRNNLTEEEKGFLFVLFGGGVIGLLFSSSFIITPSFYLFVGYCIQMAYRKKQRI